MITWVTAAVPSSKFHPAAKLATSKLELPEALQSHLGGIIECLENGTITLIEANSISSVHKHLHEVMVRAVSDGWQVKLVDIANCLDPHLISSYTFQTRLSAEAVLEKISLARPFQVFQSVSILKQLSREVEKSFSLSQRPELIIVTGVTSQFFDAQIASEDPKFPVPQLEQLRHVLGVLQGLATQGHTIILSEHTEQTGMQALLSQHHNMKSQHVQNPALAYVSKIHIKIVESESRRYIERNVTLKDHPFKKTPLSLKIRIPKSRNKIDDRQTTLADWF